LEVGDIKAIDKAKQVLMTTVGTAARMKNVTATNTSNRGKSSDTLG
jgi:hypothetical protein